MSNKSIICNIYNITIFLYCLYYVLASSTINKTILVGLEQFKSVVILSMVAIFSTLFIIKIIKTCIFPKLHIIIGSLSLLSFFLVFVTILSVDLVLCVLFIISYPIGNEAKKTAK